MSEVNNEKIALLMALLFLVAAFVGCSPAANEEGTADSGQEGAAASGEAGYKDTITIPISFQAVCDNGS